mmetsp:Transcript_7802/g.16178  ORF Transcript_7802/g.16178 Transcript_7802/m.16178 type:complete len:459 (+) Transcript_7802:115-1491(+)
MTSAANNNNNNNNDNNSNSQTPLQLKQLKLHSPSQSLPHHHLDYVLDMAFDHYGRRFATASGDRTVRVWDLNSDGSWMSRTVDATAAGNNAAPAKRAITNEWQAHKGAIHRLSWAHPEFGQLLATAGSDHAVVIWEEREGGFFKSLATPERGADGLFLEVSSGDGGGGGGGETTATGDAAASSSSAAAATSRWVNKATLSDARRAVTAVAFAPRHLGLRLASGSADGCVRIYEALDTMNLNHWKLDGVIEEGEEDEDGAAKGAGADDGIAADYHPHGAHSGNVAQNENMGVTSLSWSASRFEPAALVIGFSSGRVAIHRYDDARRSWVEAVRLPGHERGVLDVAWAPNVGRSYHWIASCGKDGLLMVHRVRRGRGGGGEQQQSNGLTYEGSDVLDRTQMWRCQWNVTGTVLASSGDGGVVKLWKADFQGRWKCVSEIVGDGHAAASSEAILAAHGRRQ